MKRELELKLEQIRSQIKSLTQEGEQILNKIELLTQQYRAKRISKQEYDQQLSFARERLAQIDQQLPKLMAEEQRLVKQSEAIAGLEALSESSPGSSKTILELRWEQLQQDLDQLYRTMDLFKRILTGALDKLQAAAAKQDLIQIQDRLAHLERAFAEHELLRALPQELHRLKAQQLGWISELESKQQQMLNQINQLGSQLMELSSKLIQLESKFLASLDEFRAGFQELKSKLGEFMEFRSQLSNQVQEAIESCSRIPQLESELESLRSNIPRILEQSLTQISSKFQNLERVEAAMQQRLDQLESQLNQIISGDWDAIKSLQSRISELQLRFASLEIARAEEVERSRALEIKRKALMEDTLELARAYHKAGILTDEEYQQMLEALKSKGRS